MNEEVEISKITFTVLVDEQDRQNTLNQSTRISEEKALDWELLEQVKVISSNAKKAVDTKARKLSEIEHNRESFDALNKRHFSDKRVLKELGVKLQSVLLLSGF